MKTKNTKSVMPKVILVLAIAFSGLLAREEDPIKSKKLPVINFSQTATDFESGQPVFSTQTTATLNVQRPGSVRIIINDAVDTTVNKKEIELSSLVEFSEGTYTVLIQGKDYQETFGFTIR